MSLYKKTIAAFILPLFFMPCTFGQKTVEVWAEYDTTGWIGDALNLKLCCRSDAPEKVNFPILQDKISEDLQIIPDSLHNASTADAATGLSVRSMSYRFSAYTEGHFQMPSFPFEFVRNDSLLRISTDTGTVHFYAPVVDTLQPIKGLRGNFEVNRKELFHAYFERYGFWLWIVLGAAILVVAGIFLYRRFKQNKPLFVPAKPPVPPIDRAIADLGKLKEKQLWQQSLVKEYYTELTDILRLYLADGMGVAAIEMTNDELSAVLKDLLAEKPQQLSALLSVLDRSVLVKFAKSQPRPDEHEDSFKKVEDFLNKQKRTESETGKTENGLASADTK